MFARYGNFQHPANEVNIARMDVRARYSPRLLRTSLIFTIYLEGELLADTQATINDKIVALANAYSVDGLDFGFYRDDGTVTSHRLPSNDPASITGVRVINRSWPQGDAAEFAVKRTFAITLQAEYTSADSQLWAWQESVEFIGNCGPRFEVIETYEGPIVQQLALRTSMKIIQSGSAIGYAGYVMPPGPLLPGIEHQEQRRVSLGSAKRQGRLALFYPSSWVYTHTAGLYTETFPVTR
jgi:hypothetical protein